jgi:hypothetical protein
MGVVSGLVAVSLNHSYGRVMPEESFSWDGTLTLNFRIRDSNSLMPNRYDQFF